MTIIVIELWDEVSSKQATNQPTDFTVDLIWWGSLRLVPIIINCMLAGIVRHT